MGYHHISAEQLRDFIRDLKKLIKFDQQQCMCHDMSKSTEESCLETAHETLPSNRSCSGSSTNSRTKTNGETSRVSEKTSLLQKQPRPKSADVVSVCRDESDACSTSSGSLSSSSSSSSVGTYDVPIRVRHANKLSKPRGKIRSRSVENLLEATKPRSSFIKPWRLQATIPQRCDPVALYHKYQTIWQQQKAPGESGHEELRWSVREKMLGQDPHPPPMSRTSSFEVVSRRRKKT